MSSKIYEEAIADAKKLREVAEDNAKKAILEAVTPRIRDFIEEQLLEGYENEGAEEDEQSEADSKVDSEESLDEEVVLDESALQSLISLIGGEDVLRELGINGSSDLVSESVKQTLQTLNAGQKETLQKIANKFNQKADILENRIINNNEDFNQENTNMSNREKFYEVDLQSLREAVMQEMEELKDEEADEGVGPTDDVVEMDAEDQDEMADLMKEIRLVLDLGEDVEADDLPEMLRGMIEEDEGDLEDEELELEGDDLPDDEAEEEGLDPELEGDVDMGAMFGDEADEEADPEALDEVFEIDPQMLREELALVRRHLREGKVDHHFGGKGGGNAGVDGAFGGKGKKNAGVKGAFGGGSEGQDAFTNPPQINKLNEAIRDLRRKNRAQAEKLNKYRGAIDTLREQLEDLNLFNAKLLYVNKLLQNKALTESQKKSVIKALDEANTLGETKALYKSLTESLGSSRGTINESARYGSSSRTTTSASGSQSQKSGDLSRWQRLAGLK